jgi:integrase
MAAIRFRNGVYQARISRKGYASISKSFLTKNDAVRWARSIEITFDNGSYTNSILAENTTFKEIIERYMREVTPKMKSAKEELIRLNALSKKPIAKLSMMALTSAKIAEYRDERLAEVSNGTVIRELAYFSSIINQSRREWGINIVNPISLVRKPKSPLGRTRILNDDERIRLFAALSSHDRQSIWMLPLVQFAIETAMRRGEMLSLLWVNVNLQRQVAFLPMTKNGESRAVPLSRRAVEILQELPNTEDPRVFPINAPAVSANFFRARILANLEDFRFHDLRHTAITALSKKLSNILELAAVTGHKELRMLKRYHHPDPEDLAKKLG